MSIAGDTAACEFAMAITVYWVDYKLYLILLVSYNGYSFKLNQWLQENYIALG